MVVLPVGISPYKRDYGIWPQRWSKILVYQTSELNESIKKMRVRYPKNSKCLLYEDPFIKSRHFADSAHNNKFSALQALKRVKAAELSQLRKAPLSYRSTLVKSLRHNKKIKTLEFLDEDYACPDDIIANLKYMRSLSSLYLNNIPFLTPHKWKQVFFGLSLSLQSVTLTGKLDCHYTCSDVVSLLRIIVELPHLKTFNFDAKTPDSFDVNHIPFNILNKRKISYNIRFIHPQKELLFTSPTETALQGLEFLGINDISTWYSKKWKWDIYSEDLLRIQEQSNRVLFLSIFNTEQIDLSELFWNCMNMTSLSIGLSDRTHLKSADFSGLSYLKNLKNLSLYLDNLGGLDYLGYLSPDNRCCNEKLFSNLLPCAKTLKMLSIYLIGKMPDSTEADILAFFKGCSKTLTHFTLIFSHESEPFRGGVDVFYKSLSFLKRLVSLKVVCNKMNYFNSSCIFNLGEAVKCQRLKELYVSMTCDGRMSNTLPTVNSLEKLELEVNNLAQKVNQMLLYFSSLKSLELSIKKIDRMWWRKLMSTIEKLRLLEKLKIKFEYDSFQEPNDRGAYILDLKIILQNHSNLKSISFVEGDRFNSGAVWVLGKDSLAWRSETDYFLGRDQYGPPKRRIYKICSL